MCDGNYKGAKKVPIRFLDKHDIHLDPLVANCSFVVYQSIILPYVSSVTFYDLL